MRRKDREITDKNRITEFIVICTLFTGHPVRRVFLCVTHMSTKENVSNCIDKVYGHQNQMA